MNEYYEIKSIEKHGIETEVFFDIATARTKGSVLICLAVKKKEKSAAYKNVLTVLKNAKKRNIIDFYVPESDISQMGPAASYLINKFPELMNRESCQDFDVIYVKL